MSLRRANLTKENRKSKQDDIEEKDSTSVTTSPKVKKIYTWTFEEIVKTISTPLPNEIPKLSVSIIIPFYHKLEEFKITLPVNYPEFSLPGVEVIILVDHPAKKEDFSFLKL